MISVLFVCTGNICRSPTAEGIFKDRARAQKLSVRCDSAGTFGYHIGDPPDYRSIAAAQNHNIDITDIRGRKLADEDFDKFDYLIAMDKGHERTMRRMVDEKYHDKIKLLLDYHDRYQGMNIPDPYYGEVDGFEKTFNTIEEGIDAFIAKVFYSGSSVLSKEPASGSS